MVGGVSVSSVRRRPWVERNQDVHEQGQLQGQPAALEGRFEEQGQQLW